MEKVVFVRDDKLDEVNDLLSKGWTVKMIRAVGTGGEFSYVYAYFVLEY